MRHNDRNRYIFRVTLVYAILASAWIMLSDQLLSAFIDVSSIQWLSTVKGIFFVAVTTMLLFIALSNLPSKSGIIPNPSPARPGLAGCWPRVWLYLFAVTVTLGMLLLRAAIVVSFEERDLLILLMFPVILSALAGGCGPGLVSTLLAGFGVNYYTIPPLNSLLIKAPHDLFQWCIFLINGVLVSILSEFLLRMRRQKIADQRLQAVTLASIGDGVITTDKNGVISFLNREAERLTGWSNTEANGHPLQDVFRIIDETSRQPMENPIRQVLNHREKTTVASHTILLTREGREQPIQTSAAPIMLADGMLLGVVLVFSDDTHRRMVEKAIEEERALYQDLVNAQPAGIYRIRVNTSKNWDQDTLSNRGELPYKLEIASDRFCELLDTDCRELHNDPGLISRRIHPEDQEGFIRANEEANSSVQPFNWEGRMYNHGRIQWVQFQSLPRQLDDGDIVWTGILTDISARKESEIALQESQAQLNLLARLLDSSSQPFAQGFPDGRLGLHNQAFLDLVGYSPEELISLDWARDLTPPEWLEGEKSKLAQLHDTGQPVRYEKEYIRKNGSRVPIELLVHLVRDDRGQPLYYYAFINDLTERMRAEAALRESEKTYRSLFENMMNAVVHARMIFEDGVPVDLEYLAANPAFATVTGISEEVVGRRISEIIPGYARDNPESLELFGKVAKSGKPELWEHYLAALDRWFSFSLYSPAPGEVVIITENITERKKAERALRESEAQLRAISDNLPESYIYQATIGTDGKSRFLFISAGVRRIHGVSPEEVLHDSRLLYEQVDPAHIRKLIQAEKSSIVSKNDFAVELRHRRPDGNWGWLLVRSRPRQRPDGTMVWDGAATDITSLKKLESELQQSQKLESVGRLAGGVAHDFNNMLTVISGHTELALDGLAPENPLYQELQEIKNAADRSANLTRQLLAFARKQAVQPVVLNLNDTLGGMLKILQRLIGEDIELAWMPGHNLWPVKIDPSQVDQLLANLAINARDAIAGVGQLTIETANAELDQQYGAEHPDFIPGQYVLLEVSDNGIGMNSETLDHIFEPFFTTKKEGQGTGLGLATVYGIVKQNQGFINVYSEPGQGTTFRIYLPRALEEAAEDTAPASLEELPGGTQTILLVEDDLAILALGRRFIERLGYKVLSAASPNQALKMAESYSGTIDLLITDVVMPEMNGKELSEKMRTIKPGMKRLFMSGYTADAIARQGILDEGIFFLPKPFSNRDIAIKIREALEQ